MCLGATGLQYQTLVVNLGASTFMTVFRAAVFLPAQKSRPQPFSLLGKTNSPFNSSKCKQRGSADCGVFALPFAASLCAGENPVQANYVQYQLRPHLWQCLVERESSAFPKTKRKKTTRQQERRVKQNPREKKHFAGCRMAIPAMSGSTIIVFIFPKPFGKGQSL